MSPRIDPWKEIAETIARVKNTEVMPPMTAYWRAIRAKNPEIFEELTKTYKYPGEIYPLIQQIAEKYRLFIVQKCDIGEGTMHQYYNEDSVQEFKQSF